MGSLAYLRRAPVSTESLPNHKMSTSRPRRRRDCIRGRSARRKVPRVQELARNLLELGHVVAHGLVRGPDPAARLRDAVHFREVEDGSVRVVVDARGTARGKREDRRFGGGEILEGARRDLRRDLTSPRARLEELSRRAWSHRRTLWRSRSCDPRAAPPPPRPAPPTRDNDMDRPRSPQSRDKVAAASPRSGEFLHRSRDGHHDE